jgi:hypothetical protein
MPILCTSFKRYFPLRFLSCFLRCYRGHEVTPAPPSPEQRQAQILQSLSPHELAYQESLIQEREAEIREIETGIHELSEIFRDLGTLVNQQGSMIGRFRTRKDVGPAYLL